MLEHLKKVYQAPKKQKIKYINNDPNSGIAYDWEKVLNLYKSLDVPEGYDYSDILPLKDDIVWHVLCSERSVGKTTTLLLLGMCLNSLYGTITQLIRHSDKEQKASYYKKLFDTINGYDGGRYVKMITGGEYEFVTYYSRAFYYANMVNGKVERSEIPLVVCLCSADCYQLCSTYESPLGDWIILDECFNESNRPEEFVHFLHLHKTICRERLSDKIFILGNNLDINNIWFRQLTIQNSIRKMHKGEIKTHYTADGMPIWVTFMENRLPEKRLQYNKKHYGFRTSETNSITGNGEWKMKDYPLACLVHNIEHITRGIFISYHDDLFLEVEFIQCDEFSGILIHNANRMTALQGDVLYTMCMPKRENEIYWFKDKLVMSIYNCYINRRCVFSDNETGDLFEKFLTELDVNVKKL